MKYILTALTTCLMMFSTATFADDRFSLPILSQGTIVCIPSDENWNLEPNKASYIVNLYNDKISSHATIRTFYVNQDEEPQYLVTVFKSGYSQKAGLMFTSRQMYDPKQTKAFTFSLFVDKEIKKGNMVGYPGVVLESENNKYKHQLVLCGEE